MHTMHGAQMDKKKNKSNKEKYQKKNRLAIIIKNNCCVASLEKVTLTMHYIIIKIILLCVGMRRMCMGVCLVENVRAALDRLDSLPCIE